MLQRQLRNFLHAIIIGQCFLLGCATSTRVLPPPSKETPGTGLAANSEDCSLPAPPAGGKLRAYIEFEGLSELKAKKYPKLVEKLVGLGFCELLVETLDDAGYFIFAERDDDMVKRIATEMQAAASGILTPSGKRERHWNVVDVVLYARLYDFFDCSLDESIRGLSKELACTTGVGVQIHIADPYSLDIIATGLNTGSVTEVIRGSVIDKDVPFAQSAVGQASQKAIQCALSKALKKAAARGFEKNGANP